MLIYNESMNKNTRNYQAHWVDKAVVRMHLGTWLVISCIIPLIGVAIFWPFVWYIMCLGPFWFMLFVFLIVSLVYMGILFIVEIINCNPAPNEALWLNAFGHGYRPYRHYRRRKW